MDGGGSIGQNEVPSPEGGGGVTGISFIYISDLCKPIENNKITEKPVVVDPI